MALEPEAPVGAWRAERVVSEQWGRVEPDGTVYLRTAEGERPVGSYPGATPEAALAYFVRKFEDLQAQVALLEQRVAAGHVAAGQLESSVRRLSEAVTAANVVGDLDGLLARLAGLGLRPVLVRLVTEPGERLTELFEQWKAAQRRTRLAKADEDALWHRFSHARTGFDRKRRHHFAALEESRQAARATKERLITEAERLAGLTDWGAGAAGFRDLMREWKAAGRVAGQDDALWALSLIHI